MPIYTNQQSATSRQKYYQKPLSVSFTGSEKTQTNSKAFSYGHLTGKDNATPTAREVDVARSKLNKHLLDNGFGLGPYSEDEVVKDTREIFLKLFGTEEAHIVPNGTAANMLSLISIDPAGLNFVCANTAHPLQNEADACSLHRLNAIEIPSADGKIYPEQIADAIGERTGTSGFNHKLPPKAIFITQPTELGALYTKKEIEEIAGFAHSKDLFLVMDGARLSNAVAALGVNLKELTKDAGVDVLSFSLAKNGTSIGDVVVFLNQQIIDNLKSGGRTPESLIKSHGWMIPKSWIIAQEYKTMLEGENPLYIRNARHANKMAQVMYEKMKVEPDFIFQVINKPQTNALFIDVPIPRNNDELINLAKKYDFYVWGKGDEKLLKVASINGEKFNSSNRSLIRVMTSFITDEKKYIDPLLRDLKALSIKHLTEYEKQILELWHIA